MRVIGTGVGFVAFIAATSAWAQAPSRVGASREAPGRAPARADADVAGLFRYEPTGLSLLIPYRRGKVPVVFIHGLWANPISWSRMIESLEAEAGPQRPVSVLDLRLFDRRPAAPLGLTAAPRPG